MNKQTIKNKARQRNETKETNSVLIITRCSKHSRQVSSTKYTIYKTFYLLSYIDWRSQRRLIEQLGRKMNSLTRGLDNTSRQISSCANLLNKPEKRGEIIPYLPLFNLG